MVKHQVMIPIITGQNLILSYDGENEVSITIQETKRGGRTYHNKIIVDAEKLIDALEHIGAKTHTKFNAI